MSKRKTKNPKSTKKKPAVSIAEQPITKNAPAKAKTAKKASYNRKRARLIEMLSTKKGANTNAIVKATGWLPHTSRAMISGLRKAGHRVETNEGSDGKTVYRITGSKKNPATDKSER